MSKKFKLQDPGEGIHEAEILGISVSEGDDVTEGDILLEVETDKAAVEVPSPFTGTIEEISVSVGDRARVGDVLMTYSADGVDEEEKREERGEKKVDGRKKKEERTKKREERKKKEKKTRKESEPEKTTKGDHPVPAAPATRRLARELGVDLREVTPSGKRGRVTEDDVRAHADRGDGGEEKTKRRTTKETHELPDFAQWGSIHREPIRGVRRATAERMTRSWSEIPHVTHTDIADISELEEFRQENKATIEKEGGKLTLTVFAVKAAVAALKAYPQFNASLDPNTEEIIYKEYVHIGVAVATDRGLLVPVVRDVDAKSISELAIELPKLSDRAREGDLKLSEMRGGSFTVTNPGGIGGVAFTPIINHPEVAILGLGAARLQPVVQGSIEHRAIVPRLLLPLCLAFDHRVIDGAGAARFVRHIVDVLENPDFLTLHT